MNQNQTHPLIPFSKLFKLLLGVAFTIQLVVITYNHLSGYYELQDLSDFVFRMVWGTALSLLAAFFIAYPDLFIIHRLNSFSSWHRRVLPRIILQLILSLIVALVASTLITLFSHLINAYEEGLAPVLVKNGLIVSVANVVLMVILEAWIFFMESAESKKKTRDLEKELSQIRFEVLKNQINPHFMFNSLNVLSGLIDKDTDKAQEFIDEFSHVYRYVLETIEQPVVTVNEELNFIRSYMYLQQIRYGQNLQFSMDVPASLLGFYLPPLSLQVVLENAIKHNLISPEKPLQIEIFHKDQHLVVRNNVQSKRTGGRSTGVGQKNLLKRYQLISDRKPDFRMEQLHYRVSLPLLNSE